MRVSTVSGVVIFAGTSGAYFGAPPGVPAGVCASLVEVTMAIVETTAAPRTLLGILIFLVSPCLNETHAHANRRGSVTLSPRPAEGDQMMLVPSSEVSRQPIVR